MKIGTVFASTGGNKMVRALRSLRRAEPDMPVFIVLDISSNTWRDNAASPAVHWFETQPNVQVRCIKNTAYINGILNAGMKWLDELGYDYGCLFHDDVIFSSLPENRNHLSEIFHRLDTDRELQQYSGLTLNLMQAFVPNDVWRRSPIEWDHLDLESEFFWQQICPDGKPAGKFESDGRASELYLPTFFIQYHVVEVPRFAYRLGPSGQIVPIKTWKLVGGFDETDGIFYDIQYPAECVSRNLPPVQMFPSLPHLHLHNQSIGYADLAKGIWNDTMGAFTRRYGKYGEFWERMTNGFQDRTV